MQRPHNNRFLEPERGTGMIGWATKQLALWLAGGLVVYLVAANHQLFGGSSSDSAAQIATAPGSPSPGGDAPDDSGQERKLVPLGQSAMVTNSLTLSARPDGYAWVNASVNGVPMTMAFDTGASYVSLSETDALRAGVAGNLNYSVPIWTANGTNPGAPVTLREIRIGELAVADVPAIVQRNLPHSLLGQTFLKRLQSYEMRGGTLTLTWQ